MYGSYGSYSSMSLSAMSTPLDFPPNTIRNHDSSCAFPSWPRRSSLSDSEHEEPRATSYLSDDDLFLPDPFEDDGRSVAGSSDSSSPTVAMTPRLADEEALRRECERKCEQAAMQQEFLRQIKMEKERRRQQALKARKGSPKKSPKMKQAAASLTTITESGE